MNLLIESFEQNKSLKIDVETHMIGLPHKGETFVPNYLTKIHNDQRIKFKQRIELVPKDN